MAEAGRYKFARLDRSGPFFGLRNGQAAIAIGGIFLVTIILQFKVSWIAIVVAIGLLLATFSLTFAARGGRGIDEWAPVVASWMSGRMLGGGRWSGRAARDGRVRPQGEIDLPRELWGVDIVASSEDAGAFGVIVDKATKSYLAVLRTRGAPWMMDSAEGQVTTARRYGELLAGIEARTLPVAGLQWIEEAYPDLGQGVAGDYAERRVVDAESAEAVSMRELIATSAASAPVHGVWLVVQLDAKRAATHIRRRGGGIPGAASVLEEEVRWVSSGLREMGVEVLGLLRPQQLADLVKNWFDPQGRPERVVEAGGIRSWGPMAADKRPWGYYRTDSAYHRTWWISEWPVKEVGPAFLSEVILNAPGYRRFSVTHRARDTARANREVGGGILNLDVNTAGKANFGWLPRARDRRMREDLERRDEQLAGGARELSYAGYLTLSAGDLDELELQAERVVGAMRRAGCQVSCLYGEQELGFLATLPLCRGIGK